MSSLVVARLPSSRGIARLWLLTMEVLGRSTNCHYSFTAHTLHLPTTNSRLPTLAVSGHHWLALTSNLWLTDTIRLVSSLWTTQKTPLPRIPLLLCVYLLLQKRVYHAIVLDKSCKEKWNTYFMFSTLFFCKSYIFWDN
jgi:hypothetical protein